MGDYNQQFYQVIYAPVNTPEVVNTGRLVVD